MSDQAEKVLRLRDELPSVRDAVYLNTGSYGPLPRATVAAMEAHARVELEEGRIHPARLADSARLADRARVAVAEAFGATPEEIALTHLTTEGIDIALWGIDWGPEDEIITTNLEHPAVTWPSLVIAHRCGVHIKVADVGAGGERAVQAITDLLSPNTRLIVLSHVAYCTGAVLPVREIVELAHRRGVFVLVDGAQAAGAIPLNLRELGADFYAIPGQKWLCGPEDTGALYVREESRPNLHQTYVGYASMEATSTTFEATPHSDARRYEFASRRRPTLLGLSTSLEWLRDEVGLDWAYARIQHLVATAREQLQQVPGLEIITPPNAAGLLSFTVKGLDPVQTSNRLAERGILLRWISEPRCLRVSLGFFNTDEDIAKLVEALKAEAGRSQ